MEDKIKQNCGDVLIIEGKSDKKVRHRYYYKGHFEGYTKKITFRLDSAKYGQVSNLEKRDIYGFLCDENNTDKYIYFVWKNMERRCYDPKFDAYLYYGKKGVTVSEEFKTYSYFKNWYLSHNYSVKYDLDKDCLSYILDMPKIYSEKTCILVPSEINTLLSTIGKGIYLTPYNTYCVRIRRNYCKINKNFKTLAEAIKYKKKEDMKYLTLLLPLYVLKEETIKNLKKYVKICRYNGSM